MMTYYVGYLWLLFPLHLPVKIVPMHRRTSSHIDIQTSLSDFKRLLKDLFLEAPHPGYGTPVFNLVGIFLVFFGRDPLFSTFVCLHAFAKSF
jgi:hypothetical protein